MPSLLRPFRFSPLQLGEDQVIAEIFISNVSHRTENQASAFGGIFGGCQTKGSDPAPVLKR